jgi:hypothetical protein
MGSVDHSTQGTGDVFDQGKFKSRFLLLHTRDKATTAEAGLFNVILPHINVVACRSGQINLIVCTDLSS